ncbi:MAG: tetratricopeptide repeat protein [Bacteroidales bacterium]|nr:tetratricopeptide repeat protein [Bacteroidales bacterium]
MISHFIRRILLVFVGVLFFQVVYGQKNSHIDSLLHTIRLTQDEHKKARLLLTISKEEEIRDPEKSLNYAKQAQRIAQKVDYDSAEVRALILMGVNYTRMMLLKEAIATSELIIEKATRNNMLLEIADGRGIMAVAYAHGGDFDNSSRLYFENLKIYEKLNEQRLVAGTLGNIGVDFVEQGNYLKALEYINKALRIGLEINDKTIITDQYNNLASIYHNGIQDYPKALEFYSKSLEIAVKIEDFQLQGLNMLDIGHVYMKTNNHDSSFVYFIRSLEIFQKLNNRVLMADSYIALGTWYFRKPDHKKSKELAMLGFNIGKEFNKLQTLYESSDLLYNIYLAEKDSSDAFNYYISKTNAQDSLNARQNKMELFRLEFQYNQEKLVKEQKIRQLKFYLLFGFIILGLFSGLVIIFLFYSRQKIKIKNTLLEKEKVESDLRFKSKELSINLMALLKKNEMISEISQKLSNLERNSSQDDLQGFLSKLNHEIKQNSDDRLWHEFSLQFKETNSEFYDKLLKQFPDLSQSELKLCAYLRLNMTTKEIADLTGQSTETLGKARYRLRKKFGLTNSESNLMTFLTQI